MSETGSGIYAVTLRHDGGSVTLRTWASSAARAVETITMLERAPESAVTSVMRVSS